MRSFYSPSTRVPAAPGRRRRDLFSVPGLGVGSGGGVTPHLGQISLSRILSLRVVVECELSPAFVIDSVPPCPIKKEWALSHSAASTSLRSKPPLAQREIPMPPLPPLSVPPGGRSPTDEASPGSEDLLDLLRLHLATSYHFELGARLLRRFGHPGEIFRRRLSELVEETGIPPAAAGKLLSAAIGRRAEEELELIRREGVTVLHASPLEQLSTLRPATFPLATLRPSTLRQGPDGPLILFARGEMSASGWLTVGVVGSRRPSIYGLRQTRRFAGELARAGVVVISGLARGIDGESHRAALDEGGCTVAVLGSGLGRIYPPEHRALAERIWRGGRGLVITPFPYRSSPRSFHFPLRNSVLSGISRLVLVVEASEKSGSLITVEHALRQGKPVFAVPGRVDQSESRGCLRLVGDGAGLAVEPADLIVALLAEGEGMPETLRSALAARLATTGSGGDDLDGPKIEGPHGEALTKLFEEADSWHPDDLAARLEVDVRGLLAELSRLEVAGTLRRLPGGRYAITPGT